MARFLMIVAFGAMLALPACGSDSDSGSSRSSSQQNARTNTTIPRATTGKQGSTGSRSASRKRKRDSGSAFNGPDRNNYERGKAVCGSFPAAKVAHDLGVKSSNPRTIAKAFAGQYPPDERKAVVAGCLAGLTG